MRHVQHVPGPLNGELEERFFSFSRRRSIEVTKSSPLHIAFSKTLADRFERDIHQILNPLNNKTKSVPAPISMCLCTSHCLFVTSTVYSVTIWSLKHTGVKQSPQAFFSTIECGKSSQRSCSTPFLILSTGWFMSDITSPHGIIGGLK